jgi:menaquinone-dependent protoporphyrinogen oxidase
LEVIMRVLVTWGSRRGGTEGIARIIGLALKEHGFDVDMLPAEKVERWGTFDAVILGGALYANRWCRSARRFVSRHEKELRTVPVWFFSSGPLDDSADRQVIQPPARVQSFMDRVGAQGHVTFGGRLERDAAGFPASAMAKEHAGDWRNPERIRAWALDIARALPMARPRAVIAPPGRSLGRLFLHAVTGWALCAATMGALELATTAPVALVGHAVAAPIFFGIVAVSYFRQRGARDPAPTALTFASVVALLDLVLVAGLFRHGLATFGNFTGQWLSFALIFGVTWIVGQAMSTMPWPKPARRSP